MANNNQMDLLKQKISIIAEIFEKREIDQKYTVDILCDFIYDKSKRVMSKCDQLTHENEVIKNEQSFYYKK